MNALEPTTSELVKQCLAGQQTAWESLLSRYERLIYHTALQTGMTSDEAADVFQAVCLIWLEELGRLRNPEQLGAWLVTTTRRECWARLKRNRAVEGEDLETLLGRTAAPDESPEALAAQNEDANAVRQALRQLPEPCHTLLELFFYNPNQLSYSDIARQLKMSINSLGPIRNRCLTKLKEILREAGW
jgi:RNA polymerase sigma factor (sigma-70 family)